MYCKRCGSSIPGSSRTCPFCGAEQSANKPKRKGKKLGTVLLVLALCAAVSVVAVKYGGRGGPGLPAGTERPAILPTSGQGAAVVECRTSGEFVSEISQLIGEYGFGEGDGEFACRRLIASGMSDEDAAESGAVRAVKSPDGVWVLQFDTAEAAQEALTRLTPASGSGYVEADKPVIAYAADPNMGSWGTQDLGADVFAAVLSTETYTPVTVAVVDSGVAEHAALDGHISSGWDMIEDDREAQDENGHGTHVAGIVLDVACGLDISVMPVRVLNGEGKGSSLTVSLGIRYAADNGADVINLSLGGLHSNYKDDSVAYALGKGVTVVVAAGNDSSDTAAFCPAHIDGCITVSAVNESLDLADFSNWGSEVDFCAPGVGVCSTVPGGYAYLNGTSMAAPHISGLAALLKASGLAESPADIQALLQSCSQDLGTPGWDEQFGYGLPRIDLLTELIYSPPYADTIFDGTYWNIVTGQTMGSMFQAEFSPDGSLLALSTGGLYITPGTYTYEDGVLTLTFGWVNGVRFIQDGSGGFISEQEYEMQVGYDSYVVTPSDGALFKEYADPALIE